MEFSVDAKKLGDFVRLTFDNTTVEDVQNEVLPKFKELGEVDGLLKTLKIEKDSGVKSNDVKSRRGIFGENKVEQEPQESLLQLMWDALQDPTLIFLTCAATFSLFIGIFVEQHPYGWLEGVAILFAVFVVVMVGAVNDYQKETQFRLLNAKRDDVQITVLRDGITKKISTFDLVVGDIILLSTGDILPADGVAIGRNDLQINEKMLTGETELKKKSPTYVISGESVVSSPTLFAGTFVQAGEGRITVLAVGSKTYQGQMEAKMNEVEDERSILQRKLDTMTELITRIGLIMSIVLVIILLVRMGLAFYTQKCCMEVWDHRVHWSELVGYIITGITIFVVAVPEGLPLAVTIALAFSVTKMLTDNNLVRHLSACETMGGATTICSDKTGTLTTSRMTVVKLFFGGESYSDISEMSKVIVKENLEKISVATVVNTLSKSYLKQGSGNVIYCGNDTECALLLLSNQLGMPYDQVRDRFREDAPGRRGFSFSSDRKRMTTIVTKGKKVMAFTKGAAEVVAELCTQYLAADGFVYPMDQQFREKVHKAIIDFADEGLRTICVAMRELSYGTDTASVDLDFVEKDLTAVCMVGIEDPLRPEVPGAIAQCRRAGIVVRMVTGDNPRTARAIAKKCNIIESSDDLVMEGKQFRETVCDANGNLIMAKFDAVWPKLRVLARSTPLDKFVLVSGIQESTVLGVRQTVAVTGDGTNDAPALKKADVGFAMGIQGTEVAKNASDVIIMDDNFKSIVAAVKWGRCVYDNICKFLQFQLTVNITACLMACVGAAILTESPLSAIQLLWVNLIMDSFASLALATEDPNDSLLHRKPYPRDQPLLSPYMLRSMLCHSAWQLVVLSVLIFGAGDVCEGHGDTCSGPVLLDMLGPFRSGRPASFDMTGLTNVCPVGEDRPADFCAQTHGHSEPTQHYTMVFCTFVLMQVFNEINSRKIHGEINVFQGISRQPLFIIIVVGTIIVQIMMVEIGGLNTAFGCTHLTPTQWAVCLLLGFSSLPMNVLFRLVPLRLFGRTDERSAAPRKHLSFRAAAATAVLATVRKRGRMTSPDHGPSRAPSSETIPPLGSRPVSSGVSHAVGNVSTLRQRATAGDAKPAE